MKKLITISAFLISLSLSPLALSAEYSSNTLSAVNEALQKFYSECRGVKLTSYAMRSLMVDVVQAFENNKVGKSDGDNSMPVPNKPDSPKPSKPSSMPLN